MSKYPFEQTASIEGLATFTSIEPSNNPSFHKSKARIMAINSEANRCNFSKDSVLKGLPTLKNIPIVTYYSEKGNLGDHEMLKDVDGKPIFKTYGIGTIPESAEQWIEEVEEDGEIKQYLCSDVLLWKRQKREYEFIQRHKNLSVSMEVQITDSEYDENKILNINDFYFTAVTVLGIGVTPAFDSATLTFTKDDSDVQDMIKDLNEFEDGGDNMKKDKLFQEGEGQTTDSTPTEPTQTTEPTESTPVEPTNDPQPAEPTEPTNNPEENKDPQGDPESSTDPVKEYQEMLKQAEIDFGKTIAALSGEKSALEQQLEATRTEMDSKVSALTEELESLRAYKTQIEQAQREAEINAIKENFADLKDVVEYQELLEKIDQYTPSQFEAECYVIVGKQARAKVKGKTPQSKLTITPTYKDDIKEDTRYGGLLFK